MVWFNLLDIS